MLPLSRPSSGLRREHFRWVVLNQVFMDINQNIEQSL